MVCEKCGFNIGFGKRFCENCGQAILTEEYPRTQLESSGAMKYRKTDLNIARLDLEKHKIDLSKEYSMHASFNMAPQADIPKSNSVEIKMQNLPHMQHSDFPKSDIPMSVYPEILPTNPLREQSEKPDNSRKGSEDSEKTATVEFILSLFALSGLNFPPMSLLLGVAVFLSTLRLKKGTRLKEAAAGVALFVVLLSALSVFDIISI